MRFASRRSPSQHQMPKIGLCTMGVPVSNANKIRFIEESTLSRWPSSQIDQVNDIHLKGLPSPWRMGFASGESPPSEWDSPAGVSPYPGGSLLQVNDIHLKGLPLSTANGIRFRGVSFYKENGILLKGVPSPQRMGFASKDSPCQQRMEFASIASLSPREWDSHQEGHPLQSEWDSHQEGRPPQSEWDSHQRVSLSKRMGFASRGSPSPKQMGFACNVGPSCSKRPLSRDSSQRPRYSRDSLFQRASPLRLSEWYSLQEIFILPNNNVWVGGLRFSSTTHSFRASSREPSVKRPHPWFSLTHPYSPLWRDKEAEDESIPGPVTAMMDFGFFTEQGSGFPLLPISIKRALLIRGHSGHILRLTTLSPDWWWLSFVLFMKRTFAQGRSSYLLVAEVPFQGL